MENIRQNYFLIRIIYFPGIKTMIGISRKDIDRLNRTIHRWSKIIKRKEKRRVLKLAWTALASLALLEGIPRWTEQTARCQRPHETLSLPHSSLPLLIPISISISISILLFPPLSLSLPLRFSLFIPTSVNDANTSTEVVLRRVKLPPYVISYHMRSQRDPHANQGR